MQRLFNALLIGFVLCITTSCSWFLGDYDGPTSVSHRYVEGVTPSNAPLYNERSYPTVQANWPGPGGDKIWLAVNLGATGRPQNSVDTSPSRAGWFFQFNRKQAFYHNGSILTPQWKLNSINENSDWNIANDPCRILLGGTWRIPTVEELRAFLTAPASQGGMDEGNRTLAFNSTLQLHAAGKLRSFGGALEDRGVSGNYWASDQFSDSRGEVLGISQESSTFAGNKAFGRSVRCIEG